MRLSLLVVLVALASTASGQTQQTLFPGETGETLLASIRAAYRPSSVLSYSGAQDRLMDSIDSTTVEGQSGVAGVYSGYFVPFDGQCSYGPCNAGDANQDVFNGGSGLNVEHTWPRSLLNGNAESDMHHLFPTRVDVNGARSNFRFAEIPDAQTTTWYEGATRTSSIPTVDIDDYSELRSGTSFEPREDHKGNVARALFYIAAVYDAGTNSDFPFDATDRQTLYDWHYADPITAEDQARSARVAQFQGGTDNPFVLDSTLARRAFFPDIVVTDAEDTPAGLTLRLDGPNPFRSTTRLALDLPAPTAVRADVVDVLGRHVVRLYDATAPAGPLTLVVDGDALTPGLYLVRVAVGSVVISRPLVRAR
jgi:hypothetical protein